MIAGLTRFAESILQFCREHSLVLIVTVKPRSDYPHFDSQRVILDFGRVHEPGR